MSDKKKGSGKNPWGNAGKNNKPSTPNKDRQPQRPTGGYQGSGQDPVDLDAMLRKAKNDFGGMFPGNMGGGAIGVALGVVLLVLFVTLCTYIVKPGEHAVVQQFGAWERTKVDEGLSFKFPWPIETVTKVNVNEIRKMNIGFLERYGRSANQHRIFQKKFDADFDRNIVDIDLVIQWNIKSAEDYLFNIKDQESTIKKVVESAIREEVGQTNMFPIITTERDAVAQEAREIIQNNLDEYNSGVNITQVLIQARLKSIQMYSKLSRTCNQPSRMQKMFKTVPAPTAKISYQKRRGAAIQLIQDAKAYKESKVAQSTGDAERFNSVYESYLSGQDVTKKTYLSGNDGTSFRKRTKNYH